MPEPKSEARGQLVVSPSKELKRGGDEMQLAAETDFFFLICLKELTTH